MNFNLFIYTCSHTIADIENNNNDNGLLSSSGHGSNFQNFESNILNTSDEDRTVTTPSQPNSISNTISIPREEYQKLCQATIDLIKANKTIERLKSLLDNKAKPSHLSPVSK